MSGGGGGLSAEAAAAAAQAQAQRLLPDELEYRQFESVAAFVAFASGTQPVTRVLVANNGIGAVKCMRSMRRWAFDTFGRRGPTNAVVFVAMATPEDLAANAEYVRMADEVEEVPGGSNVNNYANVELIVEIAQRRGVDAVWAGWGHASENPRLPESLAARKIVFLGPGSRAMADLGDKIGSTLIAQSAGVPCVQWSGSDITIDYTKDGIEEDVFRKACVTTVDEAREAVQRVGLPAMIKASEGGGGKGIRKVTEMEDFETAFRAVQGEVPGSPIFIMRMVSGAMHLEVQILADAHGAAVALYGRDCSTQRRHQKIIEEGPAAIAPDDVWRQMEDAAIRMTKAVGYVGAGTVEYLFDPATNNFFFLELNPRLQVEHPVTEQITGINLPACQLQVGMGVPLSRIPDIRRLYGRKGYSTDPIRLDSDDVGRSLLLDIEKHEAAIAAKVPTVTRRAPLGHCIAARITGENPFEGFKPTSGNIQELTFRSTPHVWGYFSVTGRGGLHEFADSQFGHVFAFGHTREASRRELVLALSELSIRGEISTPVEYVSHLLESDTFRKNRVTTEWLDGLIQAGDGAQVVTKSTDRWLAVLSGALFRAHALSTDRCQQFIAYVERGQIPPSDLLDLEDTIDLVFDDMKYSFRVRRSGADSFLVTLRVPCGDKKADDDSATSSDDDDDVAKPPKRDAAAGTPPSGFVSGGTVEAAVKQLGDGGLLLLLNEHSYVCYGQETVTGLRLLVDGATVQFQTDYDPTQLRTSTAGKLVRYLVEDGESVKAGAAYAEVEVMKMYMPLVVGEAGTVHHRRIEGSVLEAGDVLATLELADPSTVRRAKVCDESMPRMKAPTPHGNKAHQRLNRTVAHLQRVLQGYAAVVPDDGALPLPQHGASAAAQTLTHVAPGVVGELFDRLGDPLVPAHDVRELLSRVTAKIPRDLFAALTAALDAYEKAVSPASAAAKLASQEKAAAAAAAEEGASDESDESESASASASAAAAAAATAAEVLAPGTPLPAFPAALLLSKIGDACQADPALKAVVEELVACCQKYERGIQHFQETLLESMLRAFVETERSYPDWTSSTDKLQAALEAHRSHLGALFELELARHNRGKNAVVSALLDRIIAATTPGGSGGGAAAGAAGADGSAASAGQAGGKQIALAMPLSMPLFDGVLHDLAELQAAPHVARKARYCLMRYQMPSFDQRLLMMAPMLRTHAKAIAGVAGASEASAAAFARSGNVVGDPAALFDVLVDFFTHNDRDLRVAALDAYVRRCYNAYEIQDLAVTELRGDQVEDASAEPASLSSSSGGGAAPISADGTPDLVLCASWRYRVRVSSQVFSIGGDTTAPRGYKPPVRGDKKAAAAAAAAGGAAAAGAGKDGLGSQAGKPLHDRHSSGGSAEVDGAYITAMLRAGSDLSLTSLESRAAAQGRPAAVDSPRSGLISPSEEAEPAPSAEAPKWQYGQMLVFRSAAQMRERLGAVMKRTATSVGAGTVDNYRVLELAVPADQYNTQDGGAAAATGAADESDQAAEAAPALDAAAVAQFGALMKEHASGLEEAGVNRVTVAGLLKQNVPRFYTFRDRLEWSEDTILRHVEPALSYHMELRRLIDSPYAIELWPTEHKQIHLYYARERTASSPRSGPHSCFFARAIVRGGQTHTATLTDFLLSEAENVLAKALESLELAMGREPAKFAATWRNQIFMKFVPDVVFDPENVEKIMTALANKYKKQLLKVRVSTVEVVAKLVYGDGSKQPTPVGAGEATAPRGTTVRFFTSNPTTFKYEIEGYVEGHNGDGNGRTILMGSGSRNGTDAGAPYSTPTKVERKRYAAMLSGTTYVYDFPLLFDVACRRRWRAHLKARAAASGNHSSSKKAATMPKVVMDARELVLVNSRAATPAATRSSGASRGQQQPAPRARADVVDPSSRLVERTRGPGENDVGMVAWRITLYTPEYPQETGGRELIVIANDITHEIGSFGKSEDVLFFRASELARELGLPRIYVAANSGARIGLANEVRGAFDVAWKDASDPTKGFEYLFVSPEDHERLGAGKSLLAEPVESSSSSSTDEKRFRISDVIGAQDGLSVENLRFSGLIAGETSRAYEETFTLSIVTGRTVGIGSYLVRLGQRTIQNQGPIILTGSAALNKLLGRPVYTSNAQIGGPHIMHTNGVSHLAVRDELSGIQQTLQWLAFVPRRKGNCLPILPASELIDPPTRKIGFAPPANGAPYDPRHAMAGCAAADAEGGDASAAAAPAAAAAAADKADLPASAEETGPWLSGFFDRGSWMETLSGWGKTVVTGRALLGGVPVGVVCVETRTVEHFRPADPADPDVSSSVMSPQAGQVWFPDSSFKTAQALQDFNGEQLPCIVFANWRGFSGGLRDLFDEILKFGSYIVDNLRKYEHPVCVYIPPGGELRGGAWVVVDPTINADGRVEMFADTTARGGVLEPAGTVEIKYKTRDLISTMHRLDKELRDLDAAVAAAESPDARSQARARVTAREELLLPVYQQIALHFADLHDTPGRMLAKGVISSVVPWQSARAFFCGRIKRRLLESYLCQWSRTGQRGNSSNNNAGMSHSEAQQVVFEWFRQDCIQTLYGVDISGAGEGSAHGSGNARGAAGEGAVTAVRARVGHLLAAATERLFGWRSPLRRANSATGGVERASASTTSGGGDSASEGDGGGDSASDASGADLVTSAPAATGGGGGAAKDDSDAAVAAGASTTSLDVDEIDDAAVLADLAAATQADRDETALELWNDDAVVANWLLTGQIYAPQVAAAAAAAGATVTRDRSGSEISEASLVSLSSGLVHAAEIDIPWRERGDTPAQLFPHFSPRIRALRAASVATQVASFFAEAAAAYNNSPAAGGDDSSAHLASSGGAALSASADSGAAAADDDKDGGSAAAAAAVSADDDKKDTAAAAASDKKDASSSTGAAASGDDSSKDAEGGDAASSSATGDESKDAAGAGDEDATAAAAAAAAGGAGSAPGSTVSSDDEGAAAAVVADDEEAVDAEALATALARLLSPTQRALLAERLTAASAAAPPAAAAPSSSSSTSGGQFPPRARTNTAGAGASLRGILTRARSPSSSSVPEHGGDSSASESAGES